MNPFKESKMLVVLVLTIPTLFLNAQTVTTTLDADVRDVSDVYIGFNRRSDPGSWWTDNSFINLISEMNPDIVRYPAGTQANYWDWREGKFIDNTEKPWYSKEILKIPGFVNALPSRTKIVYVVNMARPTVFTGIDVNASEAILKSQSTLDAKITDMLAAIAEFDNPGKLPYAVELGNEFYFGNVEAGIFHIVEDTNTSLFYSGWDSNNNQPYESNSKAAANLKNAEFYLQNCKAIVSAIKAYYPQMKFIITTTKNDYSIWQNWNNTIFNNLSSNSEYSELKDDIHAVTQHYYIKNEGLQTVISDNLSSKIAIAEGIEYPIGKQTDYDLVPNNYKIWITEYGAVKEIAEETWASAVRYMAFTYGWIKLGNKIEQLDWHYISDNNVVNDDTTPMKLAPVGIAVKLFQLAAANMTEMQEIGFATNPVSVNGVLSLYGYKFKNTEKETLLILNLNENDIQNIKLDNLFTYSGASSTTQYNSIAPWVSSVAEGDANIILNNDNNHSTFNARKFSITVIEVANEALSSNSFDFEDISIYPNPVNNKVTIRSESKLKAVSVYSIHGSRILTIEIIPNHTIDLKDLHPGVFLLKIETDSGYSFKKIIKK